MYNIELSNPAKRFLKKCESDLYEMLIKEIRSLSLNPFPQDVVRVKGKGKEKIFRVRKGDHRIQYMIIYEKNLIFVTDVDKRPRAYD